MNDLLKGVLIVGAAVGGVVLVKKIAEKKAEGSWASLWGADTVGSRPHLLAGSEEWEKEIERFY